MAMAAFGSDAQPAVFTIFIAFSIAFGCHACVAMAGRYLGNNKISGVDGLSSGWVWFARLSHNDQEIRRGIPVVIRAISGPYGRTERSIARLHAKFYVAILLLRPFLFKSTWKKYLLPTTIFIAMAVPSPYLLPLHAFHRVHCDLVWTTMTNFRGSHLSGICFIMSFPPSLFYSNANLLPLPMTKSHRVHCDLAWTTAPTFQASPSSTASFTQSPPPTAFCFAVKSKPKARGGAQGLLNQSRPHNAFYPRSLHPSSYHFCSRLCLLLSFHSLHLTHHFPHSPSSFPSPFRFFPLNTEGEVPPFDRFFAKLFSCSGHSSFLFLPLPPLPFSNFTPSFPPLSPPYFHTPICPPPTKLPLSTPLLVKLPLLPPVEEHKLQALLPWPSLLSPPRKKLRSFGPFCPAFSGRVDVTSLTPICPVCSPLGPYLLHPTPPVLSSTLNPQLTTPLITPFPSPLCPPPHLFPLSPPPPPPLTALSTFPHPPPLPPSPSAPPLRSPLTLLPIILRPVLPSSFQRVAPTVGTISPSTNLCPHSPPRSPPLSLPATLSSDFFLLPSPPSSPHLFQAFVPAVFSPPLSPVAPPVHSSSPSNTSSPASSHPYLRLSLPLSFSFPPLLPLSPGQRKEGKKEGPPSRPPPLLGFPQLMPPSLSLIFPLHFYSAYKNDRQTLTLYISPFAIVFSDTPHLQPCFFLLHSPIKSLALPRGGFALFYDKYRFN